MRSERSAGTPNGVVSAATQREDEEVNAPGDGATARSRVREWLCSASRESAIAVCNCPRPKSLQSAARLGLQRPGVSQSPANPSNATWLPGATHSTRPERGSTPSRTWSPKQSDASIFLSDRFFIAIGTLTNRRRSAQNGGTVGGRNRREPAHPSRGFIRQRTSVSSPANSTHSATNGTQTSPKSPPRSTSRRRPIWYQRSGRIAPSSRMPFGIS